MFFTRHMTTPACTITCGYDSACNFLLHIIVVTVGILWDSGNHWVTSLPECREYLLGKAHCLYDAAVFSAILCNCYYVLNHLNIVTNEHQQWHFYHLSSISALQASALCHQFSYPIFFFINLWSKNHIRVIETFIMENYGCKICCSLPGIQIDILLCC